MNTWKSGDGESTEVLRDEAIEKHQDSQRRFFTKTPALLGTGRKVGEGKAEDVRCSPCGITLRRIYRCVWKSAHMWFWLCVQVFRHSCFYTHCASGCVNMCAPVGLLMYMEGGRRNSACNDLVSACVVSSHPHPVLSVY